MNYAFLALPAEKICESLEYNTPVPIVDGGLLVAIDDKFSALTHGFLETFSADWKCSSLQQMVENGFLESRSWNQTGPRSLFTRLLLMSAGITDAVFYKDEFSPVYQLANEVRVLPIGLVPMAVTVGEEDEKTGEMTWVTTPCETGLVHISNDTLENFAQALASQGKITVYPRHSTTVQVTCLKTALGKLLAMHAASADDWHADSIQGSLHILLDKFLESKECYCDIDVTSTLHRSCHDSGGMGDGVYVVYGHCSPYDENGWTDPREEDAEILAEARNHLLGGSDDLDWEKFTPKFGG
jgi:hypothetical protein